MRSDPTGREVAANRTKRVRCRLHHVVAGAAVDMNVDVGRNQCCIREAVRCIRPLVVTLRKALNTANASRLDRYQWILHHTVRTDESSRAIVLVIFLNLYSSSARKA
jgi:hypothetical protein